MLADAIITQERLYLSEIEAVMMPSIHFIHIWVCLSRLLGVTYALALFRLE